jgi:hypothetical protein
VRRFPEVVLDVLEVRGPQADQTLSMLVAISHVLWIRSGACIEVTFGS